MDSPGEHLLLDLVECDNQLISDLDFIRSTLISAAQEAGAIVLGDSFHLFPPYGGVSGVVISAGTHISIHTWPEYGYAAADVFTCSSSLRLERTVDILVRELRAREPSILELKRGILTSVESFYHEGR